MVCSDNIKICFIVIFNYYALTDPIVGELLPLFSHSQRDGKGACDVTGRYPKSLLIINTALYFNQINSIQPKTIGFKQIVGHYHNGSPL